MTKDEQAITDGLGKMMGWHKCTDSGCPFWVDYGGNISGYLYTQDVTDSDSRFVIFDPLHDHNHMALVEDKFCNDGGVLNIHLAKNRGHCLAHPTGQEEPMALHGWSEDCPGRLMAIALAMLAAKEKE